MITTHHLTTDNDKRIARRALIAGLLAGSARLIFTSGVAALLFIWLLNEVVTAIVYTLAALLALFFWSCSG